MSVQAATKMNRAVQRVFTLRALKPPDREETSMESLSRPRWGAGSVLRNGHRMSVVEVEDGEALKFGGPVELVRWGGTLPNRRRVVQGLTVATFVALGGNFGGVMSLLLSLDGGHFSERTKLDVLVPVLSFKRCWNPEMGFEFRYPAKWLGDQRLIRRVAERVELENPLDLPSLRSHRPTALALDPVAAFGPPGGRGDENLSVIVTDAAPGFTLHDLGPVKESAQKLLNERIAPEGSDKTARLISAFERIDPDGCLYYTMEFLVKSPQWTRHNLAVFAARSDNLYTLNVQYPEASWDQRKKEVLDAIGASFHVFETQTDFSL